MEEQVGSCSAVWFLSSVLCSLFSGSGIARIKRKVKGIWWMPWRREAMKDVARCDKPRGGASTR